MALWLRYRLERYRLPDEVVERLPPGSQALHKRHPLVFVDTAYERASSNFLESKVYPALDDSERLLVLSSPAAFRAQTDASGAEQPNWLCREVEYFTGRQGAGGQLRPVYVALAPGAPTDAFPGPLANNPH